MTYDTPGPYEEGRVVNLDAPDATTTPTDLTAALAQYERLAAEHPTARFQVQKRGVWVEPWGRAGGEHSDPNHLATLALIGSMDLEALLTPEALTRIDGAEAVTEYQCLRAEGMPDRCPCNAGVRDYREFVEALTAKLSEAGVPATPAWPDAIDWICAEVERLRSERTQRIEHAREREHRIAELKAAANRMLAAFDQSGLTDLRWFVPYIEAIRDAVAAYPREETP